MRLPTPREAVLMTALGTVGLLTGCPTERTTQQQELVQGINKLHTLEDAKNGLDAVMASDTPAIYIVSADWCPPCHDLEDDLLDVMNNSRDVVISLYGQQTSAVTDYATAQYGISFPDKAIPAVIITNFEGQLVHTEGYDSTIKGFAGTSLNRPVLLKELF